VYENVAIQNAEAASGRTEQREQTMAVGEGLAAIAFGLLEVANAIRDLAAAHRETR
jgi:hypothetical protein